MVPMEPTAGLGSTVTGKQVAMLVPQALPAVTQTVPEVLPKVTVIVLLPCPAVMEEPDGTVQE